MTLFNLSSEAHHLPCTKMSIHQTEFYKVQERENKCMDICYTLVLVCFISDCKM